MGPPRNTSKPPLRESERRPNCPTGLRAIGGATAGGAGGRIRSELHFERGLCPKRLWGSSERLRRLLLKILMGEVRSRHFENAETIGIVGESSRSFGFLNGKWIPRPSKQHAGPRHLQQERAGGGQSSRPGLGSSNRPGVGFVSL